MARLSIQTLPKTKDFLSLVRARPGYKLLSRDLVALEPKIVAQLSQDKNLLKIYGPDAKPNDVYLFTASHLGSLGKRILDAGYDPDNPTKEAIAHVKKVAYTERAIGKKFTLSKLYGAGPKKIWRNLNLDGIECKLSDCVIWDRDFNTLYAGIDKLRRQLERQWYQNGGFIYNVRGRPLPVDADLIKDLLNRFVQSSGHDILMRTLWHFNKLGGRGEWWWPWLSDLHDESCIEVREEDVERAIKQWKQVEDNMNEELGWPIKMTGTIEVGDSFADLKETREL